MSQQGHYETLDVEPSASADDIKTAFRKKASAAHPDKGGSTEAMQAINKAYEVLGDPDRRAKYDATGESSQEVTIEQKAVQLLTQLFTMALDEDGNIITIVRDALKGAQDQAHIDLKKAERRNNRLIKRRDKIAVKSGENLVHMLIDVQVDRGTRKIASIKEAIEITKLALQLLDDYTSTEDAQEQQPEDAISRMFDAAFGRKGSPFGPDAPFGQGGPTVRRPGWFGADMGKGDHYDAYPLPPAVAPRLEAHVQLLAKGCQLQTLRQAPERLRRRAARARRTEALRRE